MKSAIPKKWQFMLGREANTRRRGIRNVLSSHLFVRSLDPVHTRPHIQHVPPVELAS